MQAVALGDKWGGADASCLICDHYPSFLKFCPLMSAGSLAFQTCMQRHVYTCTRVFCPSSQLPGPRPRPVLAEGTRRKIATWGYFRWFSCPGIELAINKETSGPLERVSLRPSIDTHRNLDRPQSSVGVQVFGALHAEFQTWKPSYPAHGHDRFLGSPTVRRDGKPSVRRVSSSNMVRVIAFQSQDTGRSTKHIARDDTFVPKAPDEVMFALPSVILGQQLASFCLMPSLSYIGNDTVPPRFIS